jgi:phosphate starvation-inducible PhoH-like protein
LIEAAEILQGVNGISFVHFDESDVVRHHLVQRIIRAYDEHKTRHAEQQLPLLEPKPSMPQPSLPPPEQEEPHLRN